MKPEEVIIPDEALSERFLAATGPGGQNVNKVATACQLRVDVFKLGLPLHAYERLKTIAGSRMLTPCPTREEQLSSRARAIVSFGSGTMTSFKTLKVSRKLF